MWVEGWLRVFTDGSVSDPPDLRLALGGCAIYSGHNHPYNTAAYLYGRRLNEISRRASSNKTAYVRNPPAEEHEAADHTGLEGKMIDDASRMMKGRLGKKDDNVSIWNALRHRHLQKEQRLASSK